MFLVHAGLIFHDLSIPVWLLSIESLPQEYQLAAAKGIVWARCLASKSLDRLAQQVGLARAWWSLEQNHATSDSFVLGHHAFNQTIQEIIEAETLRAQVPLYHLLIHDICPL